MKSLNELIWNNENFNDDEEITINDYDEIMVALCGGGFGGGGINGCGFVYSH